jgi:hypothetical protein
MNRKFFLLLIIFCWSLNNFGQNRSFNINNSHYTNNLKTTSLLLTENSPAFKNAKRFRELNINPAIQSTQLIHVNDTIILDLFDDKQYKAFVEKIDTDVNQTLSIRAKLIGYDFSYCIITTSDNKSFITVDIPEKEELYTANFDQQTKNYFLQQIDKKKQINLEGSPPLISTEEKHPKNTQKKNSFQDFQYQKIDEKAKSIDFPGTAYSESTPDVITLMVVYTPAAATWSTSNETGINNTISSLIAKAQLALDNSNTLLTIQLVHSEQISYTELNSPSDLDNLTNTTDGYMDNVHTLRNTYSADVVVLLENISYTGGQGWLLTSAGGEPNHAFSLTRIQQASSTYTTIHEIGHNLGLHHHKSQLVEPGPGLYSYSAGWRWTGTGGGKYCSVMSYEEGTYFSDGITHTRVPYFSNPSITYQGVATGDATNADNARTIRQIKSVVAAYRSATFEDPNSFVSNSVSQSQINLSWSLNSNSNPVLVAWSPTGTFGTPVNGNTYSAGNTIPGGGTVLYYGTSTSYNHTSLTPSTTYYYKIWSNVSGTYSTGITTNETTMCNQINTFPWNEGFENGGNIPACWTQEQVDGSGIFWTFITGNGNFYPISAHGGTKNACLKDNSKAENKTRLITPTINLSILGNPTLKFWHTQALWSPDQDTLTVYYKNSAEGSWVQLAKYTSSITSWTQETIILPNCTSTYYISFEGNAKYGYGICIDDVQISGIAIPAINYLSNKTVANGEIMCYDATDSIMVAGIAPVELLNGSTVNLIAGKSIIILPGFHSYEGSKLNAFITLTDSYCNALPSPANTSVAEKIVLVPEAIKSATPEVNEKNIKIYPNPNNGRFTIELNNFEGLSTVTITNTQGSIVYQNKVLINVHSELELPTRSKGLYFVSIKNGETIKTNKIIVQ